MGLLDILRGMQQGPRGQAQASGSGGMSPVTVALMGLLAYKAVKSFAGASAGQGAQPQTNAPESAAVPGGGLGEVLGRLVGGRGGGPSDPATGASTGETLPGALQTLLGGGAAGSVVSSGLSNLIREFQDKGYGRAVQSWVGGGPNETITPNDLAKALGPDTLQALAQQTGLQHSDLLASLCQHLPDLINQLTPNGRVPTEEEASRLV